ncbi:carbohydrate sulfotransferase 4 [Patella vulgata]|uniref:carbohydrate sulfotransferase 4 n=1 Tax=Patella vulgata TaxID=6465 RepID=UPI0024A7F507|nr:carbohydrate sulfotransferase 4 [Patella vulgata]
MSILTPRRLAACIMVFMLMSIQFLSTGHLQHLLSFVTTFVNSNTPLSSSNGHETFISDHKETHHIGNHRHDKWKIKPPEGHVLLLAYMRSGSSFVGNVLQNSPDVVYIFEPLYSLYKLYHKTERPLTFLFKKPFFLKNEEFGDMENEVLSSFLSCNFTNLDLETLTQIHFERGRFLPYDVCLRNGSSKLPEIVRCLYHLYDECRHRNVSVAKTIRLTVEKAELLMQKDPMLKVIHLVRDPRAIISSRLKLGKLDGVINIAEESKQLCNQMTEDVILFRHLEKKYKQRLKQVRYEDIVREPVAIFKDLYQFANISYTGFQKDYIMRLTNKHAGTPCTYCVESKMALKTAHAWRYSMPIRTVEIIDKNCGMLNNLLGYVNVENEKHLVNTNVQLYK